MGIYFNPGNDSFAKTINSEIYIDKTGLISYMNKWLNTEQNCIAVSHARRFGKSQAARMLEAFYSRGCDSRSLFEKFAISKEAAWDKYLNKFNVIHMDISGFAGAHKDDLVAELTATIFKGLQEEYPDVDYTCSIREVLSRVYQISKIRFVIILDEWDCVIRNFADKPVFVHDYMQFLHDLFKSEEASSFLALGYITGILPVKKIKDESALNNFREFTMLNSKRLTSFYGFTEAEVQSLCLKYNMDFEAVKAWYDGYWLNGQHMYNPNSVSQAMLDEMLCSYWKNTSSFEAINTYITRNYDGLKDDVLTILQGGKVAVDVEPFKNDFSIIENKDDALTALIHLGYLAYDADLKQAFLPNYEVKTAFHDALVKGKWSDLAATLKLSDVLLTATWQKDSAKVAACIEKAHETYASVLEYNNENALSCVVTMAYFTAQAYYNIERELPSGKGFADIVFIPRKDAVNKPTVVVELKWDKSVDTAIKQIKEKRYAGKFLEYSDKVLLVGINYDKDTKEHTCVIETYQS